MFISEEIRSLMYSVEAAIFIDDGNGDTVWINDACAELYLIDQEAIQGRNIEELEKSGIFSPSVAKKVFQKKRKMSILHSNRQGKELLTTGVPIFDKNGKIEMVISTSRDITELVNLKGRLEDITSELQVLKERQEEKQVIITKSKCLQEVYALADRLALLDTTVLITGESGVGKGVLARYIHDSGTRAENEFVKVNCGAIPESLLESELFGYAPGAFTGSLKEGKKGLFEIADKGTIFLDEIGELPLHLQVKILQVIQDKEIKRVGGTEKKAVDVRIITATNRDLSEMIAENRFREDLYYRLNVIPIHIPPLREREEDVVGLILSSLNRNNEKYGTDKKMLPRAMDALMHYEWPGNSRELENMIERLVITVNQKEIGLASLPKYMVHKDDEENEQNINTLKEAVETAERTFLKRAVKEYKSTRDLAKGLKISQSTAVRKLGKYGLTCEG
jgi:TyrR family helix-turn-helix protein/PAS domain S-box-containing protein